MYFSLFYPLILYLFFIVLFKSHYMDWQDWWINSLGLVFFFKISELGFNPDFFMVRNCFFKWFFFSNYFWMFLDHFDLLVTKMNFKKWKKIQYIFKQKQFEKKKFIIMLNKFFIICFVCFLLGYSNFMTRK